MARRRRVDIPSAKDLKEMEAGFEVKSTLPPRVPIAQMAGDAAELTQPGTPEDRAKAARDSADAEALHRAEAEGRVAVDIPIDQIEAEELTRDRTALDQEEMEELKASISAYGMRIPIEVFRMEGGRYGLLSGFRRLRAVRELDGSGAMIRALVRDPTRVSDAYVAMVEENEIRADLSHFERGRIAVLAAGQGAFENTAAAVDALFASGSKAKRSKIRSFAMIHEELGDVMAFPQALSERAGLAVSMALKAGQGASLRQALGDANPVTSAEEWRVLSKAMAQPGAKVSRAKPSRNLGDPIRVAEGITMMRERDRHGYAIRLDGDNVDEDFMDTVLETVASLLRKC